MGGEQSIRRLSVRLGIALGMAVSATLAGSASAQSVNSARRGIADSPTLVTVASAILPGLGQAMMHQRRSLAYFLLEGAGIGFYIRENRDGVRQRDKYPQISQTDARAPFSPTGPGGDWDYYERTEEDAAGGGCVAVAGGGMHAEAAAE